MAYEETFNTNEPLGSRAANGLDEYISADTKKSLNERYEVEHVALDSAEVGATDPANSNAQGRHIPGKVGCLFLGTVAERNALSGMGNGAIAYTTDDNNFTRYEQGVGWSIFALSSETILADEETLTIVGNVLSMNRQHQQWTEEEVLLDGATISTDCDLSNTFTVTLGGNRTLENPSNMKAGATYIWRITQDPAGSRVLSYGTAFKFPGGVTPVLTTDADALDMIVASCDGTSLYCSVMYDIK